MEKLVSYNKFDPYELPLIQHMGNGFEYQYIASSSSIEYKNTNGSMCHTYYWREGKVGSPFGLSKSKLKEYLETGSIRVVKDTTRIYMKVNEEYGYKGFITKGIHIVPYSTYTFNKARHNIEFLDIVNEEIKSMKLFYYGLCAVTVSDQKGTPVISLDQTIPEPRFIVIEAVNEADGYKKILSRFCIIDTTKPKMLNEIIKLHEVLTINGQTKYRLVSGGHRLGVKKFGDKLDILESNPYSYCTSKDEVLIVEEDLIKQKKIELELLKPFPEFYKYTDAHIKQKAKMKTKTKVVVEEVKEIKPSLLGKYLGKIAKWQGKIKPNLTAFKKLFAKIITSKGKTGIVTKEIVPVKTTTVLVPEKIWGFNKDGKYIVFKKKATKQLAPSENRLVFVRSEDGIQIKKLPWTEAKILVDNEKWVFLSKIEGKKLLQIFNETQRGRGKSLIPAQADRGVNNDGQYVPSMKITPNTSSNKVKKHVPNQNGKEDSVFVNSGKVSERPHKRNGSADKKLLNKYEVTITHAAIDKSGTVESVFQIIAPNETKAINRARRKRRMEVIESNKITLDIEAFNGKITKTLEKGIDRKPAKDNAMAVLIVPKTVVLPTPLEVTDIDINGKKTTREIHEIVTYEVHNNKPKKTSTKKKKWKHPISPKPVKAPF